jgi:uncharacterized membrane protein YphA (DoxX/SURF4 family)
VIDLLRNGLTHRWTIRGCQIGIGLIFAAAALAKLGDLDSFSTQIHYFRMVPVPLENLVAVFLPWVELLAGLALLLGIRSRSGAILAAAMMALFTVGVAQALFRGLDFECGCFGTSDGSTVGIRKLAENTGMLLMAVVASLRSR